jgi:hypothetical protein
MGTSNSASCRHRNHPCRTKIHSHRPFRLRPSDTPRQGAGTGFLRPQQHRLSENHKKRSPSLRIHSTYCTHYWFPTIFSFPADYLDPLARLEVNNCFWWVLEENSNAIFASIRVAFSQIIMAQRSRTLARFLPGGRCGDPEKTEYDNY